VSTAAAFVAAGAGAKVAKHGNRAVSGLCGSADVLESVGVKLDVEPRVVETAISEIGIGFIFAPTFHPSFKFAGPPRREIGIRTIFNLLGPLTNPAGASSQLLGVYDPALTVTLARVLKELGTEEAMVVHGVGGLDEISASGVTKVTRLHHGKIETKELRPKDFGLRPRTTMGGIVSSPGESVKTFVDVLKGRYSGAAADMVLVNAAAAIVVAGLEKELVDGVARARESLSNGAAEGKLRQLIKATKGDYSRLDRLQ
jgi:anthranilate phosphoribosyltransferase